MTTTYSISEAKNKISFIAKSLKKGSKASILKNGKPLLYMIPVDDIESYEDFLEMQRRKRWDESLPFEEISKEDAISIAEAKEEMKYSTQKPMTAQEMMKFLSE